MHRTYSGRGRGHILSRMAYVLPVASDLQARYPAFTDVADDTITYWIADSQRFVDESWSEGDYAPALLSLAAHNMAIAGLGADAASLAGVPAGITGMKSGSLSLNFTPEAANARMSGDFPATRYGQEYLALLRRNKGGPLVSDTGALPCPEYPPFAQSYW